MRWRTDVDGDERLANRWGTFFIRFVWPILGIASIPGFLISLIWWTPDRMGLIVGGFAPLVIVPAFYWLVARPLRWVWAGVDGLRISDGLREVRVPYSALEEVRWVWGSRGFVGVALKEPTAVGRRFMFIPRSRRLVLGDHWVVTRLRERAGLARR